MNDSNLNNVDNTITIFEQRKDTSVLLRKLAVDFEEQLYSVKVQYKSNLCLLQEKERELTEKERTKIHNHDLFSPIYNKSYDTSDLISVIDQLKMRIENLDNEQQQLNEKISGLKNAAQAIDLLDHYSDTIKVENQNIIGDKGLSILEAQEIERQRIARDLHDTTVQNLTSMVHKSELCVKLIDIDSIRAKLELNTMSNTLKSVINDMRGIIYNLKPMTLDDLGLTITMQRYANKIMDLNNIQVKVHSGEEPRDILPVIKLTLFRVIQEACNNVMKHAAASLINIDIKYDEHKIRVSIKDNGTGFNMEEKHPVVAEQSSSFGLSIIKERISLLSGKIEIQSEKGKGTIINVSVPLTICEEDKNE